MIKNIVRHIQLVLFEKETNKYLKWKEEIRKKYGDFNNKNKKT